MGFLQEFKEFAVKGSVVDLAVGIIIGAAFGAIVKSLVDDIIMPVVGALLLGQVDFKNMYYTIKNDNSTLPQNAPVEQARAGGEVVVAYGQFINNIITFVLVALAVFLLVKQINRLRRQRKNKPVDPTDKNCTFCFQPIPIKATRCPHCTSQLPAPTPAQKATAESEGKPT